MVTCLYVLPVYSQLWVTLRSDAVYRALLRSCCTVSVVVRRDRTCLFVTAPKYASTSLEHQLPTSGENGRKETPRAVRLAIRPIDAPAALDFQGPQPELSAVATSNSGVTKLLQCTLGLRSTYHSLVLTIPYQGRKRLVWSFGGSKTKHSRLTSSLRCMCKLQYAQQSPLCSKWLRPQGSSKLCDAALGLHVR